MDLSLYLNKVIKVKSLIKRVVNPLILLHDRRELLDLER